MLAPRLVPSGTRPVHLTSSAHHPSVQSSDLIRDTIAQKTNGGDGDTGAQDVAEKSHEYRGAGIAPTHQRGEKGNWNTTARTRLWLIADKCIQITTSPYRPLYDTGRTKYTDAIHPSPCKRCGPKNNPAETGTPLSLGHQHARARRLIMKAILKDLWTEAKQLHNARL